MCGRFYLDADTEFLLNYYHMKYEPKVITDKQIFYPSQEAPVIIEVANERRIGLMKWGFGSQKPIFNSRAETIHSKVTFKEAYEKRRCIIPATGFYEWSEHEKKDRYKVEVPDQPLLHMAGIYTKVLREDGQVVWQFTVVTKEANADMRLIHHRMPLMLDASHLSTWMNSKTPIEKLNDLLTYDIGKLNLILDAQATEKNTRNRKNTHQLDIDSLL